MRAHIICISWARNRKGYVFFYQNHIVEVVCLLVLFLFFLSRPPIISYVSFDVLCISVFLGPQGYTSNTPFLLLCLQENNC